ncbi:hypothetical protein [Rhodopseudomonas palustris]|nr:hypothetical protein [Rhodopseudomonas palustris]
MAAGVIRRRKRRAGKSVRARLHSRTETAPSVAPADVLRAERDRE